MSTHRWRRVRDYSGIVTGAYSKPGAGGAVSEELYGGGYLAWVCRRRIITAHRLHGRKTWPTEADAKRAVEKWLDRRGGAA